MWTARSFPVGPLGGRSIGSEVDADSIDRRRSNAVETRLDCSRSKSGRKGTTSRLRYVERYDDLGAVGTN